MLCYYLSLLLAVLILQQSWVADTQSQDCSQVCGDVILEYPFGLIGTSCTTENNDYFTVTCKNASRAILTKLNLEVIEVQRNESSGGIMTVKIPVARTCSVDSNNSTKAMSNDEVRWNGLNLSGSPFFVDTSKNVFASVGCNGSASLYKKGHRIAGCSSRCNPPDQQIDECNGYYCCQSDLRSTGHFQSYTLRVTNSSCRAAFLTSRTFLQSNFSVAAAMGDSAAVPVVLRWNYTEVHRVPFTFHNGISPRVVLVVVLVLSAITIVVSCCCFWFCWLRITKKRRKEIRLRAKYFKRRLQQEWSSDMEVAEKTKLFSVKDLKKATNNFNEDRILGQGGQGTVYKGMLGNGQVIAIKKSKAFDEGQWKQFINEVILLSKIKHRNIVKLLGCCLETKVPMLIYEYIPNGTLSEYIHNSKEALITWEMRVRIACEVAGAISYLHSSLTTPIYHRDIKSTNILLGENYQAKVADFGISKVVPMDKTHMTTGVQGTFGYLDPEYFRLHRFSEKSDVYSFGVILVELLTGQLPIRKTTSEDAQGLVAYFMSSMGASTLEEILDPTVLEGGKMKSVMIVANLANRCLKPTGTQRPTMKEVDIELEGLKKRLSPTRNVAQQASLKVENAATMSTFEIGKAHTSPIMYNDVNIAVENCEDEQPLYRVIW